MTVIEDTTCTASALPCQTLQKVWAIAFIIVYSVSCRSRLIPLFLSSIKCKKKEIVKKVCTFQGCSIAKSFLIPGSGIDLSTVVFYSYFLYRLVELAHLISLWLHDMKAYFLLNFLCIHWLLSASVISSCSTEWCSKPFWTTEQANFTL